MRALVADRHDLFRQSLAYLLGEIQSTPAKVVEAGCINSFFKELDACNYDLIFLGSNICPNGKSANCDIYRIRNQQPNTSLILIEEGNQASAETLTAANFPIDTVLDKSCDLRMFKSVIESLLTPKPSGTKTEKRYRSPKSTLYFGATSKLTPRQQDVLRLIAFGKSNREIALNLQLSEGTVKVHVTAILRAFGVSNRTQAMLVAQRLMEKSQL